ncbi:TIGR03086 family metal-binding protein [Streptomyces alkaliterrae]|uniref:TIGR03086 family protein n=1 Tax=Streptomyces alkaliterrae TaxID=2213162 RepID=A0A5P0YXR2_9ACTN|nr:TIGR03086 family metal-binding protein [Streptomyces alkaliterrae]MBB1256686.1 TIGR03086 family protein [Streptomyces alkaliterrae]MBB1258877.1 TIGR03086 family protein [Streptomyces alkaliterrae]MQS05076.1 TIGR03086 family protein [Streptomyces alkaliterrae]
MELIDALDQGYTEFGRRVEQVADDQWGNPTPCTEWTVRDLVNHVVGEHLWAPPLLQGATLEEVGDRFEGDVLGEDPRQAWERASANAQPAFHRPGALDLQVHTSGGITDASEYGWQMVNDLAVHAWDLARGIGADDHLDEELARTLFERMAPVADQWRAAGAFGPAVDVPEDAPAQDRLVGIQGRQP